MPPAGIHCILAILAAAIEKRHDAAPRIVSRLGSPSNKLRAKMDRDTNEATDTAGSAADRGDASAGTSRRSLANGSSLGGLENNIAFYLRLAQDASFRAFKKHTGESDLRPGWFAVLTLIDANPGITPMGLSRASGRDKSTLSPILRDLGSHGLVEQCPVPSDRRSYALALTPAGKERLARLAAHARAHDDGLDEIVGHENKQMLIDLLRRIANSLD